ncbi:MAG TPA: DMT family transporter, partial [Chitinophagaceae bacterium]|nr:DMT family transporter [Chitinophagaceae bacterium]
LGESFTHNKIMGLMLGVAGASLLILLGARERRATNVVLGDFLVFLNASSYALYLVLVKPLMQSYRPVIIIRWVFLIGFFMVLPFGYTEFNAIEWSLFHWGDYAALAFIVVCCTFFTYLWNIYALRILSPSTAGAYIYLQPVFAAAIAIFFFHENLSWIKVLSSLLIFTGVYLVNTKRKFI